MNFHDLSKEDWQDFIYLSLLLVLFCSSLFFRRDTDLKKVFKYLGAWAGIGFIFVVLYSYRHEFSDFKNRILGEINPSLAVVDKSGELVISLSDDGHFYMDVKINGQAMRFMIDTGASDIVISLDDARRVGIDPDKLVFNRFYQTANGTAHGASAVIEELVVGNVTFHNVGVSVNASPMGTPLLGMSFLRQFKKYEFYRDKLILTI